MQKKTFTDLFVFSTVIAMLFFIPIPYANQFIALGTIIIYCSTQEGIVKELGLFRPKNIPVTIGMAFILAICIQFLAHYMLLPIIEKFSGLRLEIGMFDGLRNNLQFLIFSLLLGWIIGAICEELIFRAFMVTRFVRNLPYKIGVSLGIVVSSILFGLMHGYQGTVGMILTGCVGLMLGIIFIVNKQNTWLNIVTHGFINTISMVLLYFNLI